MGIAEMHQHFNAYGSGQLPEFELRTFIRGALRQEPQLSSAFIALTDAYRRAKLIDPQLQAIINADIVEVTGPLLGLTMIRAANSTNVNTAPTRPPPVKTTAGSTGGAAWDVGDGLAEVTAPLYPGAVLRDRFVLIEELGRGGMGIVYKAYDRSRGDVKDRYVAIKVLSEEFKRHPLAVRALQRETRKAQRLAHPNVVAVHDFDADGSNVYMVMEYLSGRSLEQVLRDDGQGGIPLGPAMQIIQCLAAALGYAHQQDIVHCDFKPSNAFLSSEGKVKVLDFGIARAAPSLAEKGDSTLFDAGQLGAISPTYASFELLQREQPDVRDDVYSFACVAYELLTGCHPYLRLDAVRAHQANLQPRPVRKLSRGQWGALKQGLALRRADRYPTIDSLVRDLIIPDSKTKTWLVAAAVSATVTALAAGSIVWKWPHGQKVAVQSRNEAPVRQAPLPEPAPATSHPPARTGQPLTPEARTVVTDLPTPQPVGPPPPPSSTPPQPNDEKKRQVVELLREQFETQAAAGDISGAATTARMLARASPGSNYVTQGMPHIFVLSYIHLAKAQFAAGQVSAALQTLGAGRAKFVKSTELNDLAERYLAAANIYDRLSTAVVLNVNDMRSSLAELKSTEGADYDSTAQMFAQTLADRIADHRAANRDTVADKLLESGKQVFPDYTGLLSHGTPGALQNNSIPVSDP
ncbi:MAG TPA: serine/threonine-protein kinase [Steroidobacteraceae bacterium]